MKTHIHRVIFLILFSYGINSLHAQTTGKGTLILTGGSITKDGIKAFVEAAGGPSASFIFVPSASSGIKLESGYIWEPADTSKEKMEKFEAELAKLFGVNRIQLLHTTDKAIADSKQFVAPIKKANGVWLGGGNAGRYASIFLGTLFQKELSALLDRGGVVGGNSAGAIIQGSYIVRGRPDKPVLMAKGSEQGFGFIKNFVINPHLNSAKREGELINVLDMHPELLGVAADDETTMIIRDNIAEIKGTQPVLIYDDRRHDKKWYYEIPANCKFDLKERKVL